MLHLPAELSLAPPPQRAPPALTRRAPPAGSPTLSHQALVATVRSGNAPTVRTLLAGRDEVVRSPLASTTTPWRMRGISEGQRTANEAHDPMNRQFGRGGELAVGEHDGTMASTTSKSASTACPSRPDSPELLAEGGAGEEDELPACRYRGTPPPPRLETTTTACSSPMGGARRDGGADGDRLGRLQRGWSPAQRWREWGPARRGRGGVGWDRSS